MLPVWYHSAGLFVFRPSRDDTLLPGRAHEDVAPPDGVGRVASLGNQQPDRPFQFWTPLNRQLGVMWWRKLMIQGANPVE